MQKDLRSSAKHRAGYSCVLWISRKLRFFISMTSICFLCAWSIYLASPNMEMMFPAIDNLVCRPRSRRCRSKREKGKTGIIYLVLISTICSSFVRGATGKWDGRYFLSKDNEFAAFHPKCACLYGHVMSGQAGFCPYFFFVIRLYRNWWRKAKTVTWILHLLLMVIFISVISGLDCIAWGWWCYLCVEAFWTWMGFWFTKQ